MALAFVGSLWCEWTIARFAGGTLWIPPAATLVVILILSAVSFGWGLAAAFAAGFVLDSIAPPPFGTMMLLFIALACAIGAARRVLTERVSLGAQCSAVSGLFFLAYAMTPLARALAALVSSQL